MITLEKFNYIKENYGDCASWAIWSSEGETPTSNIGNLSVLDPAKNVNLLSQLKPNVIFVGLNKSRRGNKEPFANFHSSYSRAKDYNIRFAFKNTPYWGGYMTDIIKDLPKNFDKKESVKVKNYLRKNKECERQNLKKFLQELDDIGAKNPKFIAFGKVTHEVLERNNETLKRYLNNEFKIFKIDHFSSRMNKKDYRAHVSSICKF